MLKAGYSLSNHGIEIQRIATKNLLHQVIGQGGSRLWPWSEVVRSLGGDV